MPGGAWGSTLAFAAAAGAAAAGAGAAAAGAGAAAAFAAVRLGRWSCSALID